jgi:hypothetical protein
VDPQVQAVLDQIGRQGWSLISKVPAPDSTPTTDRFGAPVPAKYPEGAEQWTITDGKGHNQTLVVKPPSAYPGPYSADVNDPGAYQPNYQVVDPPKDLPAPQATPGYTDVKGIKNADGSTTYYGRNPSTGQFEQIRGLPNEPADTKRPSDPATWQQIKAPDGRVIAMQDPVTGDRVSVPATTADKPQIVNGQGGALYAWDGTKLSLLQAGKAEPKEGDTRQNVQGGYAIQEVYRGGSWVTDPSVAPKPYDPALAGKPVEGNTRQNVASGYEIREVYRGGQWVTDPTFSPRPYSPDVVGKPKEGDTRPNVLQGYTVQETYRGGQWVVDPSVPPKPYTPQPPRDISAPAGQPYIVQQDPTTGKTSQIPNPNYQPTDPAQIVSQLQQKAQAERDRLADLPLPDEQKRAQFDTWWQQNVQPQADQLRRLQAQKDYENQRLAYVDQTTATNNEATYERQRYEDAASAGKQAVADVNATLPYRVGPGFGEDFSKALGTLSSGGGAVSFGANDFTYDMPNTDQIAEQATNRALAHISPYAAYKTGAPPPQIPQGIDYGAALSSSRYQFGGGQVAPTTTISPDGTVTIEHATSQQPAPAPGPQLPDFGAASINDPARGPGVPAPQQAPDWYTAWQARQAADAAQQQSAASLPIPDYVPS